VRGEETAASRSARARVGGLTVHGRGLVLIAVLDNDRTLRVHVVGHRGADADLQLGKGF
jgi:hypothetical protein